MLTTLTKVQESRLNEFREKWIAIGLSTAPANRKEAELAIADIYTAAGLKSPRVVWCGSPLSQGLTRAVLQDKRLEKIIGASVWDSVRASVGASVWASVGDSVRASVWDSVGASVWDSVGDSVRASVGASVGASVRASVGASVWDSVRASVGASGYGQHDAEWLAFYEFFREACGLTEQTDKLGGLTRLAKNAGWFLPHENICWVAERHTILHRDERGRLHNLSGPACAYPDGFAIHAVHGVRVPSDIIEQPTSITVQRIDAERNAEVRRVMIEKYGLSRFLLDGEAREIASDDYGILYRREITGDEPLVMVKVINSTAEPDGSFKDYFLRVPPAMQTAREAVAWTFGKAAHEYEPAVET